jgi:prepilin-type N-terminal cleavage/methylation domain-containing protein
MVKFGWILEKRPRTVRDGMEHASARNRAHAWGGVNMNRSRGFTLVELLVVIAIITILAGIVTPRIMGAIDKARSTRAASEIRGAELAIVKMLADADKQGIDKFFEAGKLRKLVEVGVENQVAAEKMYSDVFYELLRRGKGADFTFTERYLGDDNGLVLVPAVYRKLGTSYMDIQMDPWGANPYFFFAGPLTTNHVYGGGVASPFRCERTIDEDTPYVYTEGQKAIEDGIMRGNPPFDNGLGYPSAKDLVVYIWSYGGDEVDSQTVGGGDDINNWDNSAGWSAFY